MNQLSVTEQPLLKTRCILKEVGKVHHDLQHPCDALRPALQVLDAEKTKPKPNLLCTLPLPTDEGFSERSRLAASANIWPIS